MRRLTAPWLDDSINDGHREEILAASKQLAAAANRVAGVRWAYKLGDPVCSDLGNLLAEINYALSVCDKFLRAHPSRKG